LQRIGFQRCVKIRQRIGDVTALRHQCSQHVIGFRMPRLRLQYGAADHFSFTRMAGLMLLHRLLQDALQRVLQFLFGARGMRRLGMKALGSLSMAPAAPHGAHGGCEAVGDARRLTDGRVGEALAQACADIGQQSRIIGQGQTLADEFLGVLCHKLLQPDLRQDCRAGTAGDGIAGQGQGRHAHP